MSQLVDLPTIGKDWVDEEQFTPRYNIGPKGDAAILLMDGTDGGSLNDVATSRLVLRTMPWGIVSQEEDDKHVIKDATTYIIGAEGLINNVSALRSMRDSKRCVIVCQGCVSSSILTRLHE